MSKDTEEESYLPIQCKLDHVNAQLLIKSLMQYAGPQKDYRIEVNYVYGGTFIVVFTPFTEKAMLAAQAKFSCYSKTTKDFKSLSKKKLPTELINMILKKVVKEGDKSNYENLLPLRCLNKFFKTVVERIIPTGAFKKKNPMRFQVSVTNETTQLFAMLNNALIIFYPKPEVLVPISIESIQNCAKFVEKYQSNEVNLYVGNCLELLLDEEKSKNHTRAFENYAESLSSLAKVRLIFESSLAKLRLISNVSSIDVLNAVKRWSERTRRFVYDSTTIVGKTVSVKYFYR